MPPCKQNLGKNGCDLTKFFSTLLHVGERRKTTPQGYGEPSRLRMPGITPKKTGEGLKDSNSLEAPAVLGGVTVGCAGTRTLVPSPGELQTCELR